MNDDPNYLNDISPQELHQTLVGFLGQTYSEISRYDSNIVSPNAFLAPKKNEFQAVAQKVMNEVRDTVIPQQQIEQPIQNIPAQTKIFLDTGVRVPPPPNDPSQMEFTFDNSITAITINNKLEDIEKKIKKLDNMLSKMLLLLEGDETKNSE
jgi:hypothetical protein